MWTKEKDGSFLSCNGELAWMSSIRFVEEVCGSNACFLCGKKNNGSNFNGEHVIPNWLLHALSLHQMTFQIPNGFMQKYGTYKLPCCQVCNTRLGEELEKPLSQAFHLGDDNFLNAIVKDGAYWHFYCWLGMIFLKIHLRDKDFKWQRDTRKGDSSTVGDRYDLPGLHHLQVMVKGYLDRMVIDPSARGTLLVSRILDGDCSNGYDLVTWPEAKGMMLRLRSLVFFVFFDDGFAAVESQAMSRYPKYFKDDPATTEVYGFQSLIQAREMFAEMSVYRLRMNNQSTFYSEINPSGESYSIKGSVSDGLYLLAPYDQEYALEVRRFVLKELLLKGAYDHGTGFPLREEEVEDVIKKGIGLASRINFADRFI